MIPTYTITGDPDDIDAWLVVGPNTRHKHYDMDAAKLHAEQLNSGLLKTATLGFMTGAQREQA
jgi:hypothetical protein